MINDRLQRSLDYLRISLTDRCNYRCTYCMPKDIFDHDHRFLQKKQLLSFEEIISFVQILSRFNLKKIRLTGGEPLLRRNIETLISSLKNDVGIENLSLTTNGSLLDYDKCRLLKQNGLDAITISLDSLRDSTNSILNPYSNVKKVIDSIYTVIDVFGFVKINVVVMAGVNSNQILEIIEKFKNFNIEIRFIEFMDVGETNQWNLKKVFSSKLIIDEVKRGYELLELPYEKGSTAQKWKLVNYPAHIGTISSITQPFCNSCSRARLSANGIFYTCLFASHGYDVLSKLREHEDHDQVGREIETIWKNRVDQYSLDRLSNKIKIQKYSKIEMSYIGG